jgi:hypothetical protein
MPPFLFMYLYDNYCYETLQQAVDAEISAPIRPTESGVAVPVSFDGTNLVFSSSSGIGFSVPRVYPACSSVGYQHNLTGVSLEDAVESSWLVVLAWAIAWAIKHNKRAL